MSVDHRALQRALFRVQLDRGLAERVLAGDAAARASLGLGAAELGLLLAVDPDALRADPGDRRKLQMLGNLAAEYPATALVAPDGLLEGFLASDAFHRAIAEDRHLAPAFGAYARERALALARPALAALAALEHAMAVLRRRRAPAEAGDARGALGLSARASLVRLPAGTLAWASALAEAAKAARALPGPALREEVEIVLLLARPAGPHALPDVAPEVLEPAVARLCERAERGLRPDDRAALAAELGASPAALDAFLAELVADGVLAARAP